MAARISIFAVVFCVAITGQNAAIPPALLNTHSGNCRYEFVVPDASGICSNGDAALDKKIDQVKTDMDRGRLQYVSQNSVLQDQLSKVQTTADKYGIQMDEMYSELRQIRAHVGSFPAAWAPGGADDLQRSVHTAKDYLNKALHDLENKLFNISYQVQKDAIEQSKVNTAVEMQVHIQEERGRRTEEQIRELLKSVITLRKNPNTGAGRGHASPVVLSQVKNKLAEFEKQIQFYDQMQQQQLSTMQLKSNDLALTVSNHSHQINDLSVESQALLFQIASTEKKASSVTGELKTFQMSSVPKIATLEKEVVDLETQTATLKKNLEDVAKNAMGASILSKKEKYDIHNLETSIDLLSLRISDIVGKMSNQSSTIKTLAGDLDKLSTTLNPTQLGILNQAMTALQNTGSLGSVTTSDLQQVENEIRDLNKLVESMKNSKGKAAIPTTKSSGFHIPTLPVKKVTPPKIQAPVPTTTVPTTTTAKSLPSKHTSGLHIPQLPVKSTSKLNLAVKFPTRSVQAPTTAKAAPALLIPVIHIPTLPVKVAMTPKLQVNVPSTRSSKVPSTAKPPPGMHIPTLPMVPSPQKMAVPKLPVNGK